jgi:single-strand DNA-binding protein
MTFASQGRKGGIGTYATLKRRPQAGRWPHSVLHFLVDMASRSVNKVILVGHLGKDAETRFTPSGVPRTTFGLATSRRWKDQQTGEWKEETDWHNVVLWRSENLANYLTKGKQLYVEGRLQTRSYDDKDGNKRYMTEVVAGEVILLGGRGESAGAPTEALSGGGYDSQVVSQPRSAQRPRAATPPAAPAASEPEFGDQGISDDDVPF